MNIYVGNLPYDLTQDELKDVFAAYGDVATVNIITDKMTRRSKGFAFIEMPDKATAEEAVGKLNGFSLKGRNITVSEAKPRTERNDRKPRNYERY
jgi:RNA recognition motif-containing protein